MLGHGHVGHVKMHCSYRVIFTELSFLKLSDDISVYYVNELLNAGLWYSMTVKACNGILGTMCNVMQWFYFLQCTVLC